MERVVQSLCAATAGRVESRVVAFNTAKATVREEIDGVAVTRVGVAGAAGSVPVAPGLWRELRRVRADLLVVHEPNPWALTSLLFARVRIPVVVWFHSEVVRPRLQYALFYEPVARPIYGRARRIAVSSPALAEQAMQLSRYRDKIAVVPFGIDAGRWEATPARRARAADVRRAAGGRPLVLFAGRMVPYKGVDVLLRALVDLDAAAVLVGTGPSRAAWIDLARTLGLDGRVRFAGEVPHEELAALLHACDVFVLPSVTPAEAFGYVQLEAMACARPVVSTRVASGVPWVNRDRETGLTVPPGDVPALRAAIAALLGDGALAARLGAAGRARATSEFTMTRMAERTIALYEAAARG
jgi:rhamnosyl/mannosyltransferase